jgi:flagellar FliL protein
MADITQAGWKGSKVVRGLAVLMVLVLGVLTAMGSLGCKSSSPASNGPGKGSHAPSVKAVMHLEPFVVNLADPEDNRFLRIGIELGLENPPSAKEGKGGESEVPTARIRDCILAVLSTWHSDALLAPEGKEKLKDELVRALRARVPELGVREVYFTDFLVQR